MSSRCVTVSQRESERNCVSRASSSCPKAVHEVTTMTYKEKLLIDDLEARLHEALEQIKDQQATVTKRDVEIAALMKEMAVWKTRVAQMNVFSARIMGR